MENNDQNTSTITLPKAYNQIDISYKPEDRPKRSLSLSKLAMALAKAQGVMEHPEKNGKNSYGPYSTIADTWNAIRKPLADNEIAVIQRTLKIQGKPTMCTMLLHSSGEFIDDCELELDLQGRQTGMQALGSAITYARRYTLQAVTGVAPEDDDGEAAVKNNKAKADKKPEEAPESAEVKKPSEGQLKRLFALGNENGWGAEEIKKFLVDKLKIESTKQLSLEQYENLCSFIEKYPIKKEAEKAPEGKSLDTPTSHSTKTEIPNGSVPEPIKPLSSEPKDYVVDTGSEEWSYLNGLSLKEIPPEDQTRLHKWLSNQLNKKPAPKGIGRLVEIKRKIEKNLSMGVKA